MITPDPPDPNNPPTPITGSADSDQAGPSNPGPSNPRHTTRAFGHTPTLESSDSDDDLQVQTAIATSLRLTQRGLNMSRDTVTASGLAKILEGIQAQLNTANTLIAMHRNQITHAGPPDTDDSIDLHAMEDN